MVNLPALHVQCWKAVIFATVLVVKMSGLKLVLSSNTVVLATIALFS